MSKKHGAYYKIRFAYCWCSKALANQFEMDFRSRLETILRSGEALEAVLEGGIVKYRNSGRAELVNNNPLITLVFGLQWEGSGRESLARFSHLRLKPKKSAEIYTYIYIYIYI